MRGIESDGSKLLPVPHHGFFCQNFMQRNVALS